MVIDVANIQQQTHVPLNIVFQSNEISNAPLNVVFQSNDISNDDVFLAYTIP